MAPKERFAAMRAWLDARPWGRVVVGTFQEFAEDKAARLGAALAYYTVFSIAPLLVISIAIAGFVLGEEAARGQLLGGLTQLLGTEGGLALQEMVANAYQPGVGTGILATALGVAALLFGATGVFAQLKDALNTIWEVRPRTDKGAWRFVRTRILSFGMVLAIGFLLLASLMVTSFLALVGSYLQSLVPGAEAMWLVVNFLVAVAGTTLAFAALFRFLPDARIAWRDVWLGALVTAVLFNVGQLAIGLYLGRGSVASVYGAAGSLVVLLLWVFYSAQIFFLGAEFTQVYANELGSRVVPEPDARRVTDGERTQEGIPRSRKPT